MNDRNCGCNRVERAGDWDESEHPRDPDGKFAGGGGGDGGGKKPSGGKHPGKGYSAAAKLIGGVIYTTKVEDAARALHENREVELDQPAKVSALVKKLGAEAAKMIEQGKAAPTYNLCNVMISGESLFCHEHKDIPRVKMPQLDKKQTREFRKHLKEEGYKVKKETVRADYLRATQNEINGAKVALVAQKLLKESGGQVTKRLIVSKDNYVLDGHHHWAAKLGLDHADGTLKNDLPLKIARVDISITKLLKLANKFTGGKGAKPANEPLTGFKDAGQVLADLYRATFDEDADEVEAWVELFEQRQAERKRQWEVSRACAEQLLGGSNADETR